MVTEMLSQSYSFTILVREISKRLPTGKYCTGVSNSSNWYIVGIYYKRLVVLCCVGQKLIKKGDISCQNLTT